MDRKRTGHISCNQSQPFDHPNFFFSEKVIPKTTLFHCDIAGFHSVRIHLPTGRLILHSFNMASLRSARPSLLRNSHQSPMPAHHPTNMQFYQVLSSTPLPPHPALSPPPPNPQLPLPNPPLLQSSQLISTMFPANPSTSPPVSSSPAHLS